MKNEKLIIGIFILLFLIGGNVFSQEIVTDEDSLFGADESAEIMTDEDSLFGSEDDEMFSESKELESEIIKNLTGLKYG